MKTEYLYVLIGLLAGILITWVFSANAVNSGNQRMMGMMGMRSNIMLNSNDTIDAHFIEQMIPHHEDAITMAQIALEKSTRSEVRELATNIIDSQGREIEQMKDWYRDWFGKEVPQDEAVMGEHGMGGTARMHMGMMGDESDISDLSEAEDFDRAFLEEMIPHHQMAVMMANMLKIGTTRVEMQQLADDIIAAQTREIEMMRGWLAN